MLSAAREMGSMSDVSVRRARPEEAADLTALAMRAKASWGYDADFMAQCRAELTLTADKMASWTVWVAEQGGQIAGMIALAAEGESAELEDFMVEPGFQGMGVGRALMDALLAECHRLGLASIGLDADPNAEPVYRKLGFTTVGQSPSGSIPGRMLPRMVREV
jgi:GNAT superfamily N-acetyltransferase